MVYLPYTLVGKYNDQRVVKLFQIARKLSTSGAIGTINEIHPIPSMLNIFLI